MAAYVGTLVEKHAKAADAALNSGDLGSAEVELNRAKSLDKLRADLKQG